MADENAESIADEKVSAKPASQKNPLITLLLILNMAGLGTVAYFQYKFMDMESKRPDISALLAQGKSTSEIDGEALPTVELDQENLVELASFTVNLAQGDGPRRYVRLNTVLKLDNTSELSEIEARKPQIRDAIISLLNSKRPKDILKQDGKFFLKEQIKASINSFLIDAKIVDIFFNGFQIQ